ncbi:hypothetical protein RJ639_005057 [Escallonia herrerae]|uniref:Uncharacterized protein n=1 Tax=Escallonia herrerae TaxID=1293975 RepID=A0AA88W072_9ASTE|nr:hypothetical protein RJ639_005057 [Escallonia herrerae]
MLYVLISFVLGVVVGLISSSHIEQYFSSHAEAIYTNGAFVALGGTFDRCEVEDCLSMESFLQPKYAMHGMSDEELFWRASMVPQMAEYPYKKVPKVAFMFLTRGPLPLMPLWERFFHGQSEKQFSIYVHALPGYELNVTNTSVVYRRQISSKWGSGVEQGPSVEQMGSGGDDSSGIARCGGGGGGGLIVLAMVASNGGLVDDEFGLIYGGGCGWCLWGGGWWMVEVVVVVGDGCLWVWVWVGVVAVAVAAVGLKVADGVGLKAMMGVWGCLWVLT